VYNWLTGENGGRPNQISHHLQNSVHRARINFRGYVYIPFPTILNIIGIGQVYCWQQGDLFLLQVEEYFIYSFQYDV